MSRIGTFDFYRANVPTNCHSSPDAESFCHFHSSRRRSVQQLHDSSCCHFSPHCRATRAHMCGPDTSSLSSPPAGRSTPTKTRLLCPATGLSGIRQCFPPLSCHVSSPAGETLPRSLARSRGSSGGGAILSS